jgi:hypothetical protein
VYVDHLVTKRQTETHQDALPDPSLGSFSTVGRCSSVGLGPDGARMLRLLSLRFCGSTAGSDDWAFAAQRLRHADQRGQRLVSVKVGAVGSPVAKGDLATVVADSSASSAGSPTWRRVATLRGSGSHWGSVLTVPTTAQPHQPYSILIQGRVTEGNRYRIQWWQSVWTYRAWAR